MADAVPISDVLCEAMEYLSKLGSNLRVRSDNLKEKRIRKDKLRNVHAVQKAANKVLLICQLSKKSLENVETGVKKVLKQIDLSQDPTTSDGGSSSYKSAKNNKVISYDYIEYDSHRLRIRKKVDMKHYTSVKVLAKKMPISMQDKYPVFLNCKLYRLRSVKSIELDKNISDDMHNSSPKHSDADKHEDSEFSNDKTIGRSENELIECDIVDESKSQSKKSLSKHLKWKSEKDIAQSGNDQNVSDKEIDSLKDYESSSLPQSDLNVSQEKRKSNNIEDKTTQQNKKSVSDTAQKIQDTQSNAKEASEKDSENETKKNSNKKSPQNPEEKYPSSKSKEIGKHKNRPSTKIYKSEKSKKFKHIKVINDSSDSDENKPSTEVNTEKKNSVRDLSKDSDETKTDKTNNFQEKEDVIDISNSKERIDITQDKNANNGTLNSSTNKEQTETCVDVVELNDSSNEETNTKNNESKSGKESVNESESEKMKDSTKDKENNSNIDKKEDSNKKDTIENENDKDSKPRPFLRCVSLDKLIKKNVENPKTKIDVTKKELKSKNKIFSTKHEKSPIKQSDRKRRKLDKALTSSEESSKENEEEYWIQKRKEVKLFKPKNFVINVKRLPQLSEKYLCDQNLRKITQNGSVVCEVQILEKKNHLEESDISDVNTAKNALLCDSDSDKSKDLVDTPRKAKKALLRDSGSKKEENPLSPGPKSDDKRNSESEKQNSASDKEGRNNKSPEPEPVNKVSDKNDESKSSLLKDSTDKNHKTPTKKITKNVNTPPSKRKHIMESMHAKKMLLTYSSSSDTEDEQLSNVFKEIRDSLLEMSGDESKEQKIQKNVKPSSDSDESSVKAKKMKKRNTSKNSLSENENNSKKEVVSEDAFLAKDTNSQVDQDTEEISNSSFQKMGSSKSVGSSSQNSDTQESHDKVIDGLTNLETLFKKNRRRGSTSTDRTRSSRKPRNKMPKVPQISEEGFLKAEDSSEEASLADSDVGEEVELPAVPISDLNGDGIGHLAKDDLLGESDSSSSHVKSSQDVKDEDDTDEDEAVRARRRNKGHATISSDSEAGGSRKKDPNVKFSDFEESDDDSVTGKRSKRKKKISDSDASGGSSNEGKKKRRRIKNIDDSDGSGSETENEGRNKHGRKNIRRVMGKNQLEEATKKAAREEKERIARIAERQKLYNNLEFDESGKPDEIVLDKVVLDFDPETKEPLIEVDKGLVKKLKPHQANGIKFMWDACFESVKRIKKDKGSGCILAHCMGLGKTLQVVSLTHTLLIHSDLTRVNRVLVVCPLSTVLNWVNEFKIWLKHAVSDYEVDIYELSRYKQNSERAWQLQQWFSGGGVCVLGYEMFRNLSADNVKKFKKKMLKSFQESLVDPGPDLVVCDEGHLLKNEKTSLSQAMNRVKTLRRIVLTGTPLQNNLKEYYCMVQFVKPNLLGKYNEYLNRFVNPITNGQYTDSNEHDIRIMKRRSHVLHKMLDGAVQRRDYGVLAPFLPPKHEFVLFITLSEVQIKLYQHYLDNYSRRPLAGKSSGFLFPDFQSLQRIWTHPLVLKYNSERYEIMQQKKREREEEDSEGSLVDFIDDDSTPDESSTEESSGSLSDLSDDSRKKSKKKKATKKSKNKGSARRGTRANPVISAEGEEDVMAVENDGQAKVENPTEWWMSLVSEDELDDLRHSHKLVLLFDILRQCEAIGDKLLVFSQSLYSLDLIEHFLGKVDEATQEGRVDEKLNGHVGSWSPGVDYFRLDGSTSCENRSIWCKNFNREDNPRARLFLISTRAGGLGINLVAANRVVIFDVSWNPSHDVQSIFRVYRFGQKKPCYIYRFLAMGTMEEKIYERQVTKQAISKRVIDEQQIDRHYAENDLAELYKFEPNPPTPRELPPLPKDRLFAEILKEYEAQIYKYHEHDSLLENKEEETLTEEERKAAWEDFENEKTRPPPVPFNAYNMHNGMVPGLLAQQQQQLAYAALAAMLRKDMPNINDDQIRNMLPLIYNSNPAMFGGYDYGLMQKMSEIYKYAQAPMMNPGMVNPVLNPAGGAGGNMALGGSSGLQYEPPWQRQQQQQHQMNLQRLMQQQQQQNYYAGGLGSRDPVAMALQQQRAREMMLGERGRPRGRPPGTTAPRPRAPQHSGDVVDLDSD
ncbi:transcriptional regulator ATRX homolog isoform X2 [Maniola jurtina]|uniref:transcriptional regulator ATRX homolog isoform X2 n=1 Tax=Maniola jurtina TaxID=191418 RepID=UPI001E68C96C|nr:transcriptional regulator ATRX homolog isoform X2 [Maniola jurtina]